MIISYDNFIIYYKTISFELFSEGDNSNIKVNSNIKANANNNQANNSNSINLLNNIAIIARNI